MSKPIATSLSQLPISQAFITCSSHLASVDHRTCQPWSCVRALSSHGFLPGSPSFRQSRDQLPHFSLWPITSSEKAFADVSVWNLSYHYCFNISLPCSVFITTWLTEYSTCTCAHSSCWLLLDQKKAESCMGLWFLCLVQCCVLPWDSSQCLYTKQCSSNYLLNEWVSPNSHSC